MTSREILIVALKGALAALEALPDEQPEQAPSPDDQELVRPCDLGIPTATAKRAHSRGEIELYKVGRELRCRRADALAWLATRALSASKPHPAPVESELDDDIAQSMISRGLARRAS